MINPSLRPQNILIWPPALRALRHRNFRLFFTGQLVSLMGTWMQQVAMGWYVYRITHSSVMLGVVGFAGQIATFLLSPLAGVMADRWDRRKTLLWVQSLSMAQAVLLAFLVITDQATIGWILVLSVFMGVVNAFDIPTRQSFLIEMVDDRGDLANAIALNSTMFNLARLIGPTAAGVLIVWGGEALCFSINAVTYLAIIVATLMMRLPKAVRAARPAPVLQDMKEGVRYVAGSVPIRSILILLAVISFFGYPYTVLMPVFAKDILLGGSVTFGYLMGAIGLGALAGALSLAFRKDVRGLLARIAWAVATFSVGLMLFSFNRDLGAALVLLTLTGFGMMVQVIASNTIIQTLVDDDKRGRVMSFFAMSFMGMTPLGSLVLGYVAHLVGTPMALFISGLGCLVAVLVFMSRLKALRALVREGYIQKGVIHPLPETS